MAFFSPKSEDKGEMSGGSVTYEYSFTLKKGAEVVARLSEGERKYLAGDPKNPYVQVLVESLREKSGLPVCVLNLKDGLPQISQSSK